MKNQHEKSIDGRDKSGRFVTGHKVNSYSEEQLEIFIGSYCAHLASGMNQDSFKECDYRTLERYASKSIMQTEKIRKARAIGMHLYETILIACITGVKTEFVVNGERIEINPESIRPATLIFAIKNKYPEVYGNKKR